MGTGESEGRIVHYTAAEIDEMIARGEDKTDWVHPRAPADHVQEQRYNAEV